MPRYMVTLEEIASYQVFVEAENEEEAGEKAEDAFNEGNIGDFPCEVHNREIGNVALAPIDNSNNSGILARQTTVAPVEEGGDNVNPAG